MVNTLSLSDSSSAVKYMRVTGRADLIICIVGLSCYMDMCDVM